MGRNFHSKKKSKDLLVQTQEIIENYSKRKLTEPLSEESRSLDGWQQDALEVLNRGNHLVIDAPTTSGKTRVIEEYFANNIGNPNFRVCYTCPVKSLSNDKLSEFRKLFGPDYVGIATGDRKENLDAPIIIATLETYRNSLIGIEPDLDRTMVVFDEYHFIEDPSRGSAWEEAIILTPQDCQIVLMSASFANPQDFAGWLEGLGYKKAELIQVKKRPVSLIDLVWWKEGWVSAELMKGQLRQIREKFSKGIDRTFFKKLVAIDDLGLSPSIIYCDTRKSCSLFANLLTEHLTPLSEDKSNQMVSNIQSILKDLSIDEPMDKTMEELLTVYGIGYHHSGLPPALRLVVEALLKKGSIRFCFASMGISLGVNFSVKSTVIVGFSRPGDQGRVRYSPSEILQMTGRAGRRGRDYVGYNLWLSPSSYKAFGKMNRPMGVSRFKLDPSSMLSLLSRDFTISQIERFYQKSFRNFSTNRFKVKLVGDHTIRRSFKVDTIPCRSPLFELSLYKSEDSEDALCHDCHLKVRCHKLMSSTLHSRFASIQGHLHLLKAIDRREKLTSYGKIAQFFPQSGGLLFSELISRGVVNPVNLKEGLEIIGCFSLAFYRRPRKSEPYHLPLSNMKELMDLWKRFYPMDLFPEYYDYYSREGEEPKVKDFNPLGGLLVRRWLAGNSWQSMVHEFTNERFEAGDLLKFLNQVKSVLSSISSLEDPEIKETSLGILKDFIRKPINLSF